MLKSKFTLGALSLSMLLLAGCSDSDEAATSSAENADSGKVTSNQPAEDGLKKISDSVKEAEKPKAPEPKKEEIGNKKFDPLAPADRSEYVELQPYSMTLINAANTDLIEEFDTASLSGLVRTDYNHVYTLATDVMMVKDVFEKKELEVKLDEAIDAAKADFEGKLLVKYTVGTFGDGGNIGLRGYDFDAGGFQIGNPYITPGADPTGTFGFPKYKWVTINAKDLMFYPVPDIDRAKSLEAQRASHGGLDMTVYGTVTKISYSGKYSTSSFLFEVTPHYIDFANPRSGEIVLSSSEVM